MEVLSSKYCVCLDSNRCWLTRLKRKFVKKRDWVRDILDSQFIDNILQNTNSKTYVRPHTDGRTLGRFCLALTRNLSSVNILCIPFSSHVVISPKLSVGNSVCFKILTKPANAIKYQEQYNMYCHKKVFWKKSVPQFDTQLSVSPHNLLQLRCETQSVVAVTGEKRILFQWLVQLRKRRLMG